MMKRYERCALAFWPIAFATGCVSDEALQSTNANALLATVGARSAISDHQARLEAWHGHSFSDVVTAWGAPEIEQTFDDGAVLVTYKKHREDEGDGSGAEFFKNLSGSDRWASLVNSEGQTRTQTCTVNFKLSPAQRVQAVAIQEDTGHSLSHCADF
ncbi:MAG: hypothetical protein ACFB3T_11105, partial [Geminicoccaceae bacterium]